VLRYLLVVFHKYHEAKGKSDDAMKLVMNYVCTCPSKVNLFPSNFFRTKLHKYISYFLYSLQVYLNIYLISHFIFNYPVKLYHNCRLLLLEYVVLIQFLIPHVT